MRIEPFDPSDLVGVIVHPSQARHQELVDKGLIPTEATWTARRGDEVLAFGGLVETQGEIGAWILFTDRITTRDVVVVLIKAERARRALKAAGFDVVVDVDPDSEESQRMARIFGFLPIGTLSANGRNLMRMKQCTDSTSF